MGIESNGRKAVLSAVVLATVLATVLCGTPVRAQGTDPGGQRMRAAMQEILEKRQAGGGSARINEATLDVVLLCKLATATSLLPTFMIWDYRMSADKAFTKEYSEIQYREAVCDYCKTYSSYCDFWTWSPTCLGEKMGK